MNILFGKHVTSSDQKGLGILKELLVHPDTRQVAFLVVQRGLFFSTDTLIPFAAVTGVAENAIQIGEPAEMLTSRVQVISAPETQPHRSLIPPGLVPGEIPPPPVAPDGTVSMDHDTPVESCRGESVGRVMGVMTSDGKISHIRTKGGLLRPERMIPEKWVAAIVDNSVLLTITAAELEKL